MSDELDYAYKLTKYIMSLTDEEYENFKKTLDALRSKK